MAKILSGREQAEALLRIPDCVDVDDMDGTWENIVFRVENVVINYLKRGIYTTQEATSCRSWLRRYAPGSMYASVRFAGIR
jgi:hypothetical protein